MKKELRLGILSIAIYLVFKRFLNIPDFILGFLMGLALLFIIIGLLPEKTYVKIKKIKNSAIKSIS